MSQPDWDTLRKLGERLGRQLVNDVVNKVQESTRRPERPEPSQAEVDALRELELRNAELESVRFDLREARLASENADRAFGTAQKIILKRNEQLRRYRDRFGLLPQDQDDLDVEAKLVAPTDEDDPYPRFWRWTGGNTHFYRVDSPDVVYFKFRTTDNWVRAGSMRENDCGPQHAPPLERDWDQPDDPRDSAERLAARLATMDRDRARAAVHATVGHGTDDRSHDGPLYALLPADWPRVFEQLIRETDPDDHADWRDQLHEALLTTVDDWVDGLVLDNFDRARDAHERLRRATGAGPEEDSGG